MSLDGKLLSRARARLADNKLAAEERHARRTEEVYERCPRVRELDRKIQSSIMDVIAVALNSGENPAEAVAKIRDENMLLQSERVQTLMAAGFPPDYLDGIYNCENCGDTGYVGAEMCTCLKALYEEEQRASLSSLLKLGDETFDNFDLSWYDDTPNPATGISPRKNMEVVYDTCVEYARKFGRNSYNLFLNGAPGLGKTFLSACIARVVSESGFSVVYDTASAIFTRFEEGKFSRSEDLPEARSEIRRYKGCDLLILDDLGTEMTTAFTVSALYELINTRLTAGKKTVISSNLSLEEMRRRYSPQIMSRLEGEYQVLMFYGRDIRLLKKRL